MNRRVKIILTSGAAVLLVVYLFLPLLLKRWTALPLPEYGGYFATASSTEHQNGLAPVQLSWEAPPDEKGYWRTKKSARLLLVQGQAFVGDVLLPREKITAYLNARVQSGEIDYVIIFPVKDTKWGDIFPVLDECRKSRVQIVLLNQFES